jgi:hypothetical protein
MVEWRQGAGVRSNLPTRDTMRDLQDVDVTVIEIDSDGDGISDEELVIVEDPGTE